MLLWNLALTGMGSAIALFGRNLPTGLKASALAAQGALGVLFIGYTAFASNPFLRIAFAPIEGQSLNPILQDPFMAIHPPFLYAGYVGFSVVFSLAVAALIEGRADAAWARWIRPWALGAWSPADHRHHAGLVLGLLRARLGWLVVLGPGGERQLHALAGRDRPDPLRHRYREARRPDRLDGVPGAGRLQLLHARRLPGSLGGADLPSTPSRSIRGAASCCSSSSGWRAGRASRCSPGVRRGWRPVACSRWSAERGALVLNNLFLAAAAVTVALGTLYPLAKQALTGEAISVGGPLFRPDLRAADGHLPGDPARRASAGLEARRGRSGAAQAVDRGGGPRWPRGCSGCCC